MQLDLPKAPYCSQECFKVSARVRANALLRRGRPPVAGTRPAAVGASRRSLIVVVARPPTPDSPQQNQNQNPNQAAWGEHKQSHATARTAAVVVGATDDQLQQPWLYCTQRGRSRSTTLPPFGWTGRLRPDVIAPPRQVPPGIPRPDYSETGYPESEVESKQQRSSEWGRVVLLFLSWVVSRVMPRLEASLHPPPRNPPNPLLLTLYRPQSRNAHPIIASCAIKPKVPIRTAKEVEGIRAACLLARRALDAAHAAVRPGVTTDKLDRIVHETIVEGGGYPSPLNYYNFPKSVCTSVNEASRYFLFGWGGGCRLGGQ